MQQRRALIIVTSCCAVAAVAFTATAVLRNAYDARAVRNLIAQLASPDEKTRENALSELAERNVPTQERLIQLLTAPNSDVQVFAAAKLAEPIPTPPAVIEAFTTFVAAEDKPQNARVHALSALGKCGQLSSVFQPDVNGRIIDSLCAALASEDEIVACSAALAIYHFGATATSAKPTLVSGLDSASELVRVYSAGALFRVDPDSSEIALQTLLTATRSADETVIDRALMFLPDFGEAAVNHIASLQQLQGTKPNLAYQIQDAIDKLESGQITK